MKRKANKKISYGKVELEGTPFDPKQSKVKITTWVDADVLLALREQAARNGSKYQTLMNHILREAVSSGRGTLEDRLKRIEDALFKKHG